MQVAIAGGIFLSAGANRSSLPRSNRLQHLELLVEPLNALIDRVSKELLSSPRCCELFLEFSLFLELSSLPIRGPPLVLLSFLSPTFGLGERFLRLLPSLRLPSRPLRVGPPSLQRGEFGPIIGAAIFVTDIVFLVVQSGFPVWRQTILHGQLFPVLRPGVCFAALVQHGAPLAVGGIAGWTLPRVRLHQPLPVRMEVNCSD